MSQAGSPSARLPALGALEAVPTACWPAEGKGPGEQEALCFLACAALAKAGLGSAWWLLLHQCRSGG